VHKGGRGRPAYNPKAVTVLILWQFYVNKSDRDYQNYLNRLDQRRTKPNPNPRQTNPKQIQEENNTRVFIKPQQADSGADKPQQTSCRLHRLENLQKTASMVRKKGQ